MTLAIDLNDVLRDYTGQFKEYYIKAIDPDFTIEDDDITSFHYSEVFPFDCENDYLQFRYVDYPFELCGKAPMCDNMLQYRFGDWIQNTLKDLDEEKVPDVMIVSALESPLTIQATYHFLSVRQLRVRETYFPTDSSTIWDKCDILITANPNLLSNVPEGKVAIRIEMPYNKDIECKYSFKSLMDVILDKDETVINILDNNGESLKEE